MTPEVWTRREEATLRARHFRDPAVPGPLEESRAIQDLHLLTRRVAATPRTSVAAPSRRPS